MGAAQDRKLGIPMIQFDYQEASSIDNIWGFDSERNPDKSAYPVHLCQPKNVSNVLNSMIVNTLK